MFEPLIAKYGLLAIFAGAGIEGEAVVVTGGVLAGRGFIPLAGVMVAAALGSFMLDQAWFHAGRRFRDHPRIRRIAEKPAFARAERFIERHPRKFIMAFRFIPGMRTIGPVAVGMSHIATRLYVGLNLLAAAIWAPLLASIGYWLGHRATSVLQIIGGVGTRIFGIAVAVIVITAVVLFIQRKRRQNHTKD